MEGILPVKNSLANHLMEVSVDSGHISCDQLSVDRLQDFVDGNGRLSRAVGREFLEVAPRGF